MKERLISFFKNPRNGKSRTIGIILTIVALVEILAIMLVSTSAWVESINSLKIYNIEPGIVESAINQKVNLASSSSNTYNLANYFRSSGAYHLTGASSTDGKTMFFPEIGSTTNYRIGGVNDKNVNYISFTIRTQTAVDLAFDQVPTIFFGGTELSDDNRKLVRFSVGDNAGNFTVYSLYPEKFTDTNVVIDENGTIGSAVVYPFADYVKGKDRVVSTTANGLLSFNMWIQDPNPTPTSKAVYDNKALAVSNLKLVIVKPFTVYAASTTGTNGAFALNNTGGNVAIENSAYGASATFYAVPGQQVTLHALASESNGFSFLGWNTTNPNGTTNTSVISGSKTEPYTYTIPSSGTTTAIYAKFSNVHNIYMKPEYQFKGSNDNNVRFAAYVFGVNASGVTTGTWYNMTNVTWNSDGGYYRCTYYGNATSIIFCYMNKNASANNWDNRWLQTYDLQVPSTPGEYGYNITCRQILNKTRGTEGISEDDGYGTNKLLGFWLHNHVKVNVAYTSTSASGVAEKIYPSLTDTSDATGKAEWYDDAHKNKYLYVDGKAYQDLDSNGNIIAAYHYDKKVTLTAELASNSIYQFDGWYSTASGTGTTNRLTTAKTYEITAPDNNAYTGTDTEKQVTYYAKYSLKPAATVNIYVTPRQNWSGYFLHVWDGAGVEHDVEPSYDTSTGYYKATITTRSTGALKCNLAKDSNYTGQTGDITLLSSVTMGSTYSKRISRTANSGTSGVTNLDNYHCWWFIGFSGLKSDWDRGNDPSEMIIYTTGGSPYNNVTMLRQDDYSWIYESNTALSSFTNKTFYFKEVQKSNHGNTWNEWSASYNSSKRQYTATDWGGAGSWTG